MKNLKQSYRKVIIALLLCVCYAFTSSCDPSVWQGIAAGMSGMSSPNYGVYTPTTTTSSSYSSSSYSSSSSSSTSRRTCPRCNGTGNCKTCGGTGKVYDYGPASAISKEKYTHNCGVCNGRGKCGVCDGKGYN